MSALPGLAPREQSERTEHHHVCPECGAWWHHQNPECPIQDVWATYDRCAVCLGVWP